MRLILAILSLGCFVLQAQESKSFKGVNFTMTNRLTAATDITPVVDLNANYISIIPYAFVKDDKIVFDSKFQWIGEKTEGIKKCIELAQKDGLKVMLKPHVWIGHGTYTGDFKCTDPDNWAGFEKSYQEYIMHFVDIAVEYNVPAFCIGTEFASFIEARPAFWKGLIKEIKKKYKGKLTYAANWDEFDKVPFWNQLDYIGIDAYFPLSSKPNPKISDLKYAWKVVIKALEKYSADIGKPIVFTEFGFKSSTHCTIKPWEDSDKGKYSEKMQKLAFQACFETIWKEEWFAGGFIWKWYHNHDKAGGKGDTDYTPQNKLAEETIKTYFKQNE
ncbi:glycoside hydrolase [Paracrocinitomix mangrovi]|uniref:glycoside hydrolase family 113 n=1 Tax=Paracrocinitomix mangrovi TaxID=2862509 RepID=UPI001C8E4802|nr:glycoside hydrolase [Paracrocinitomix mangrovi]UKN02029.1 glycoside hydrolase [Paracrocinitomix mangrovi]